MRIVIDNLDGEGPLDYTASIRFDKEARIERQLNKPVRCVFSVVVGSGGLRVPARTARVVVSAAGTTLFTGYIATTPVLQALGKAEEQDFCTADIVAISDEVLLDATLAMTQNQLVAQTAESAWGALGAVSLAAALPIQLAPQVAAAGRLEIERGMRWSEVAAQLASATGNAYRVLAGEVMVSALGESTHAVAMDDPGLQIKGVKVEDLRWLAQDVTVCGREEPTAYVTEVFQGDGVTTTFALSQGHFSPAAAQKTKITELFQGTALDPRMWTTVDPGGQVALTAAGLTCAGGSGRDGFTSVTAVQQLELGGALTLEGSGVQISSGSVGRLLGLYTGAATMANCLAAFAVSSVGSVTSVEAVVNGSAAGTSFTPLSGHLYTLRLRLFSQEMQRVRQTYFYQQADGLGSVGGQVVTSSGLLVLEVQDVTSGAPGVPVTLYSGTLALLPPSCTLAVLSSGSLFCSVRSVQSTQTAPLWVTAGTTGGAPAPQYLGTAAEGGACSISSSGNLAFYPATIPAAGQLIFVSYRLKARAVGRQISSSAEGVPTSMWLGSVDGPVAWSRADCENAAVALVSSAENTAVAWHGSYAFPAGPETQDVWPGDGLLIAPLGGGPPLTVYVEQVVVALSADRPGVLRYTTKFANAWAEGLCIKLSASVPADVVLPQQATSIATALLSLSALSVLSVTTTTLNLDTGSPAPVNGGFEVRRRENTFGPGIDSDLVLRTSTRTVSIPRLAPVEQYYVRMYDASVPPNYSEFSAAVLLHIPTQ